MQCSCVVLLCLTLVTVAESSDVTPLQKVVEMLNGMLAKGKSEKHDEQVEFAKFHQWCDSTRASLETSIEEAAAKIVQLKADIAKAESDAEVLAGEITDLEAGIAQMQAELKNATAVREKEHADYTATHTDFSESISAIERAVQVL